MIWRGSLILSMSMNKPAVLICATGEGARWHGGEPKQLAWLGDETILQRQIRQCNQRGTRPTVFTHDTMIARHIAPLRHFWDVPDHRRWLAETIFSTQHIWRART